MASTDAAPAAATALPGYGIYLYDWRRSYLARWRSVAPGARCNIVATTTALTGLRGMWAVYLTGIIAYDWATSPPQGRYLSYLTIWGVLTAWVHHSLHAVLGSMTLVRSARSASRFWTVATTPPRRLLYGANVVFEIATTVEIVITLLYWTLLFPEDHFSNTGKAYANASMHAITTGTLLLDLWLGCNRPRDSHILYVLAFGLVYLCVNVAVTKGTGKPVYPVLKWDSSASASLVIGAMVALVASFYFVSIQAWLRDRIARKGCRRALPRRFACRRQAPKPTPATVSPGSDWGAAILYGTPSLEGGGGAGGRVGGWDGNSSSDEEQGGGDEHGPGLLGWYGGEGGEGLDASLFTPGAADGDITGDLTTAAAGASSATAGLVPGSPNTHIPDVVFWPGHRLLDTRVAYPCKLCRSCVAACRQPSGARPAGDGGMGPMVNGMYHGPGGGVNGRGTLSTRYNAVPSSVAGRGPSAIPYRPHSVGSIFSDGEDGNPVYRL